MSKFAIFHGHSLMDPAHLDNSTGQWICDGWTAVDWAQEGMRLTQDGGGMGVEAMTAFVLSGALQALQNNEEE